MAARKSKAAESPPEPKPPFYIAAQDIYVGDGSAGTMPTAAFRKGDQVHTDLVESNGWADQVELPDGYKVEQPEADSEPEAEAAETDGGGEPADETSSAPADDDAESGAEGVTDASTRDAS
jgi:hypothetical protein